ncbi:MAG: hypothetical protein QXU32_07770 [Nitrososphaerales archaeon]
MTKMMRVELDVENVNTDQAKYWVDEIANQYADLVVDNVNISGNKVTFNIGSPSMDDLTPDDIKFRIEEYLTMNEQPFKLKNLRVG